MTKAFRLRPAHRIARINYLPRVLGFLSTFVAILLITPELELGTPILLAAVAAFLVYPHLAWLHTRLVTHSKRAEQINLLLDCILLGTWAALLAFNLWITFSLLVSSLLNNSVNGGLPRLALAFVCFVLGGLLGVGIAGPAFVPTASLPVTAFVIITTLLYILGVGVTYHRQNGQLARAHKDIARKNDIFRSLLDMGVQTYEAKDVPDLIQRSLRQFRALYPTRSFGIVLFDRERADLVRHAGFLGAAENCRQALMDRLRTHNQSSERYRQAWLQQSDQRFLLMPLHRHLQQSPGYLMVDSQPNDDAESALPLFVDQLGAALENQLLTQELRKLAETDGLTGLFNRAFFEEQLAHAIWLKKTHSEPDFSVVMIDLIGLKRINDHHGHESGDELIRQVARQLKKQARRSDVAARYGGDEFVILCHDCAESDAQRAVERLTTACQGRECEIALSGDRRLNLAVNISVGVAGSDQHPPDRVLRLADQRMYEDKEAYYQQHSRYR